MTELSDAQQWRLSRAESWAAIAASIGNKFLLREKRAERKDFIVRRNWELGNIVVVNYPEHEAIRLIDDIAQYEIERGGVPVAGYNAERCG